MADIPSKPTYTHGSTGTVPPKARDYQNGDPLDADEFDYFVNTEFETLKDVIDILNELDSDDDGRVDAADTATLVKNNDIDSDGDGRVNEADTSRKVKGNDIDSDGDGRVDAADHASNATNVSDSYKGNDLDSDGDGKVDAADNADNADLISNKRVTVASTEPSSRADKDIWIDTS